MPVLQIDLGRVKKGIRSYRLAKVVRFSLDCLHFPETSYLTIGRRPGHSSDSAIDNILGPMSIH